MHACSVILHATHSASVCARLSVRWVDLLDLKMIGAPPVVCSKILSSIGNDIDDPKVVELPQVRLCRPGG